LALQFAHGHPPSPSPRCVDRKSPPGGIKPGHGMTKQTMTVQSTEAIRRWRLPAIVTLAATAALIASPPADAVVRQARPAHSTEAAAPRDAGEPLMAIVSIKSQHVTIYDAEGWILRAPVSSGTTGRETPAGVFSVVQKDKDHHSNLYDDAWMPNMLRITWSGIALQTQLDTVEANAKSKLDAATAAQDAAKAAEARQADAAKAAREAKLVLEPVSVFISRATQRLYVRHGFEATLEVPVTIRDQDKPIGTHVFTAVASTDRGLRWTAVTIDSGDNARAALDRISIPQDVLDRIAPTALPRSS